MRVKGQVTWKYKYLGGDEYAELYLKRVVMTNGKSRVLDELILAEYPRGPSTDAFTSLAFDFKPDNNPDNNKFWQTDGAGKVMSGLNYKLDPQVSLQPRNCYHTHSRTRTHTLLSRTHTRTHTHRDRLSLSLSLSHTHTHTHTLSLFHTHTHRAGDLALYYYAGNSDCELTFQDMCVEATVQFPSAVVEVVCPAFVVRPTLTLTLTLTLALTLVLTLTLPLPISPLKIFSTEYSKSSKRRILAVVKRQRKTTRNVRRQSPFQTVTPKIHRSVILSRYV